MTMTARARIVSLSLALVSASGCTKESVDLGHDDVTRGTGAAPAAASGAGGAASASTKDAGKPGAGAGARSESGGSSGTATSQPHDAAAGYAGVGGTDGTEGGGGDPTGGTGADSGGDTGKGGSTGTGGSATGGSTGGSVTGGSDGGGGAATGGGGGSGGTAGSGGSATGGSAHITGPCDIYAAASPPTPCVAAYSTTRLLNSQYSGPLYQVRAGGDKRGTGGTLQDIGTTVDGVADAASVDTSCSGSTCTVSILYDQSGNGNHLTVAKKGCYAGTASEDDYESGATKGALQVGGHKVYGLYMDPHEGYRNNSTSGMPTGDASQGIYEVVDGTRYGTACCWEFGNASTDNCDYTRESSAIFFGVGTWGNSAYGGPWFFFDSGAGALLPAPDPLVGCGDPPCGNAPPPMSVSYALGIVKSVGGSSRYAIKFGNAQAGSLTTAADEITSVSWQLGGGIILGIGSDNSNSSQGTFFEGAITAGWPSDETDALVFENVQAAKYEQ